MTPIDALVAAVRDAASYNTSVESRPEGVLWCDENQEFLPLLPALRERLPELLTYGQYDVATRTGPAVWLRAALGRRGSYDRYRGRSDADPLHPWRWPGDVERYGRLPGASPAAGLVHSSWHVVRAREWEGLDTAGFPHVRPRTIETPHCGGSRDPLSSDTRGTASLQLPRGRPPRQGLGRRPV